MSEGHQAGVRDRLGKSQPENLVSFRGTVGNKTASMLGTTIKKPTTLHQLPDERVFFSCSVNWKKVPCQNILKTDTNKNYMVTSFEII